LTTMYENFDAEGVEEILQSMPFPSMEALYADRPLTAQERADVGAYLEQVGGLEPPRIAGALVSEAFAGLGVLFIIFYIFGRRRLSPVRSALSDQSRSHR
ncbi:MAG: hypothetical protein IH614_14350, partial [Desulfuromonadales bacterium]|nr:hypothetical protein [Desulfuromonadales bacterium]